MTQPNVTKEMKTLRLDLKSIEADVAISDGYHTFDELYDHRITLYIALCNFLANDNSYGYVWRSLKHSDGSDYEGWFLLGIGEEKGKQITYHIPISRWDELDNICVQTRGIAPEFDGHTSADVLERIKNLIN